ncbi:MAG: hypothetical protein IIA03_10155, partial [Proteobacteria bacterium]|nr:hypothetical protein [Pseudomonadota bacterium]
YLDPERTHVFARVPLARVEKNVLFPLADGKTEIKVEYGGLRVLELAGLRRFPSR